MQRTSVGNGGRERLGPYDKPIQGIFRWDADQTHSPAVLIKYLDDEGAEHEERVDLIYPSNG